MKLHELAMLISIDAHGDTHDKYDDDLYLSHVARVVVNVANMPGSTERHVAVAWLHDVLEDTPHTAKSLREALLAGETDATLDEISAVVTAVDAITKRKGEALEDYLYRVKDNEDARFVKLHGDNRDNFRRNHKITDPETRERMARKYSIGMDILA